MLAKFYIFSKRRNSTKLPPADSPTTTTDVTININDPNTSMVYPNIRLQPVAGLQNYNYVYLQTFGRYYFINDWGYNADGTWTASCSIDALASWKTAIINNGGYVGRAQSNADDEIIDALYPSKDHTLTASIPAWTGLEYDPFSGCYVLGVLANSNTTLGSVTYYLCDSTNLQTLAINLMSNQESDWSLLDSISNPDAVKSLVDPFQFIVCLKWLPVPLNEAYIAGITAAAQTSEIYIWGWQTGAYGRRMYSTSLAWPIWQTSGTGSGIELITTWKEISMGNIDSYYSGVDLDEYPAVGPFANYDLITPWGTFALDSSMVSQMFRFGADSTTHQITFKYRVMIDIVTGLGTFIFTGYMGSLRPAYEFFRTEFPFAKDVPLSQATISYLDVSKAKMGAMFGLFGALSGVSGGGGDGGAVFSGIERTLTSIMDARAASISPSSQSNTSGASAFTPLYQYVMIQMTRYKTISKSPEMFGKPVKKYFASLANFSGFVMMDSPSFAASCLDDERTQILDYLRGGFYIE